MDFVDWLKNERKSRGLSQSWIEKAAKNIEGKPLAEGTLSYIETRNRSYTAEQVIRIARALKIDIIYALFRAGYVLPKELHSPMEKIFDNPKAYRLCNLISQMDNYHLDMVEDPILAIIETCSRVKGGDAMAKPGNKQTGFG